MKPLLAGLFVVASLGGYASLEAQYLAPRQYLQRLPQTQTPAAPAPYGLPPGPTVTPPPNAAAAPTAAEANKAAANKEAALKRIVDFQRKRAEGGSASAQYTLGMRYVQGDGVEKNLAEGCKWLRASAKQDHVWARKKIEELEKELGPLPPDPAVKPDSDSPAEQPGEKGEPTPTPPGTPAPPPGLVNSDHPAPSAGLLSAVREERLELRVHSAANGPTLVYLPGLHGDWTLIGPFRRALGGRATFVEITYPRTVAWSLSDYGRAVAAALLAEGIAGGWLLAESFGSQVAWAMLAEPVWAWPIAGVVLAGGFVRYAPRWLARGGERAFRRVSAQALQAQVRLYLRVVRWLRYRTPADQADLDEFARRRTERDKAAAAHRLALIATADWRPVAAGTRVPVFHLAGLVDAVVCWWPVRRWLRRRCPGFGGSRLILASDHNVLNSAPSRAADQVLRWIESARSASPRCR